MKKNLTKFIVFCTGLMLAFGIGFLVPFRGNFTAGSGSEDAQQSEQGISAWADGAKMVEYEASDLSSYINIPESGLNRPLAEMISPLALTGAGTSGDPYLIATADDLADFMKRVNGIGYASTPNIWGKLTADIDLALRIWTPIGYNGVIYTGTFDGDGHTITGLTIDSTIDNGSTTADSNAVGLFGQIGTSGNGSIKNVNLTNAYISRGHTQAYLIGKMGQGTVYNCSASGFTGLSGIIASHTGALICMKYKVQITVSGTHQKAYITKMSANEGTFPSTNREFHPYNISISSQSEYTCYFGESSSIMSSSGWYQTPTRIGYSFLGWSKTASGTYATGEPYTANTSASTIANLFTTDTAGLTLYARWELAIRDITVVGTVPTINDANNAGRNWGATPKQYGSSTYTNVKLMPAPIISPAQETFPNYTSSATGYTFLGFSKTAGSNTVDYAAGAAVSSDFVKDSTIIDDKLYMVWQANTVSVQINPNGGTAISSLPTIYYGDSIDTITDSGANIARFGDSNSTRFVRPTRVMNSISLNFLYFSATNDSVTQKVIIDSASLTLFCIWGDLLQIERSSNSISLSDYPVTTTGGSTLNTDAYIAMKPNTSVSLSDATSTWRRLGFNSGIAPSSFVKSSGTGSVSGTNYSYSSVSFSPQNHIVYPDWSANADKVGISIAVAFDEVGLTEDILDFSVFENIQAGQNIYDDDGNAMSFNASMGRSFKSLVGVTNASFTVILKGGFSIASVSYTGNDVLNASATFDDNTITFSKFRTSGTITITFKRNTMVHNIRLTEGATFTGSARFGSLFIEKDSSSALNWLGSSATTAVSSVTSVNGVLTFYSKSHSKLKYTITLNAGYHIDGIYNRLVANTFFNGLNSNNSYSATIESSTRTVYGPVGNEALSIACYFTVGISTSISSDYNYNCYANEQTVQVNLVLPNGIGSWGPSIGYIPPILAFFNTNNKNIIKTSGNLDFLARGSNLSFGGAASGNVKINTDYFANSAVSLGLYLGYGLELNSGYTGITLPNGNLAYKNSGLTGYNIYNSLSGTSNDHVIDYLFTISSLTGKHGETSTITITFKKKEYRLDVNVLYETEDIGMVQIDIKGDKTFVTATAFPVTASLGDSVALQTALTGNDDHFFLRWYYRILGVTALIRLSTPSFEANGELISLDNSNGRYSEVPSLNYTMYKYEKSTAYICAVYFRKRLALNVETTPNKVLILDDGVLNLASDSNSDPAASANGVKIVNGINKLYDSSLGSEAAISASAKNGYTLVGWAYHDGISYVEIKDGANWVSAEGLTYNLLMGIGAISGTFAGIGSNAPTSLGGESYTPYADGQFQIYPVFTRAPIDVKYEYEFTADPWASTDYQNNNFYFENLPTGFTNDSGSSSIVAKSSIGFGGAHTLLTDSNIKRLGYDLTGWQYVDKNGIMFQMPFSKLSEENAKATVTPQSYLGYNPFVVKAGQWIFTPGENDYGIVSGSDNFIPTFRPMLLERSYKVSFTAINPLNPNDSASRITYTTTDNVMPYRISGQSGSNYSILYFNTWIMNINTLNVNGINSLAALLSAFNVEGYDIIGWKYSYQDVSDISSTVNFYLNGSMVTGGTDGNGNFMLSNILTPDTLNNSLESSRIINSGDSIVFEVEYRIIEKTLKVYGNGGTFTQSGGGGASLSDGVYTTKIDYYNKYLELNTNNTSTNRGLGMIDAKNGDGLSIAGSTLTPTRNGFKFSGYYLLPFGTLNTNFSQYISQMSLITINSSTFNLDGIDNSSIYDVNIIILWEWDSNYAWGFSGGADQNDAVVRNKLTYNGALQSAYEFGLNDIGYTNNLSQEMCLTELPAGVEISLQWFQSALSNGTSATGNNSTFINGHQVVSIEDQDYIGLTEKSLNSSNSFKVPLNVQYVSENGYFGYRIVFKDTNVGINGTTINTNYTYSTIIWYAIKVEMQTANLKVVPKATDINSDEYKNAFNKVYDGNNSFTRGSSYSDNSSIKLVFDDEGAKDVDYPKLTDGGYYSDKNVGIHGIAFRLQSTTVRNTIGNYIIESMHLNCFNYVEYNNYCYLGIDSLGNFLNIGSGGYEGTILPIEIPLTLADTQGYYMGNRHKLSYTADLSAALYGHTLSGDLFTANMGNANTSTTFGNNGNYKVDTSNLKVMYAGTDVTRNYVFTISDAYIYTILATSNVMTYEFEMKGNSEAVFDNSVSFVVTGVKKGTATIFTDSDIAAKLNNGLDFRGEESSALIFHIVYDISGTSKKIFVIVDKSKIDNFSVSIAGTLSDFVFDKWKTLDSYSTGNLGVNNFYIPDELTVADIENEARKTITINPNQASPALHYVAIFTNSVLLNVNYNVSGNESNFDEITLIVKQTSSHPYNIELFNVSGEKVELSSLQKIRWGFNFDTWKIERNSLFEEFILDTNFFAKYGFISREIFAYWTIGNNSATVVNELNNEVTNVTISFGTSGMLEVQLTFANNANQGIFDTNGIPTGSAFTVFYQWQKQNGTGWENINDVSVYNSKALQPIFKSGTGSYRCMVKLAYVGNEGNRVDNYFITTSVVTITVSPIRVYVAEVTNGNDYNKFYDGSDEVLIDGHLVLKSADENYIIEFDGMTSKWVVRRDDNHDKIGDGEDLIFGGFTLVGRYASSGVSFSDTVEQTQLITFNITGDNATNFLLLIERTSGNFEVPSAATYYSGIIYRRALKVEEGNIEMSYNGASFNLDVSSVLAEVIKFTPEANSKVNYKEDTDTKGSFVPSHVLRAEVATSSTNNGLSGVKGSDAGIYYLKGSPGENGYWYSVTESISVSTTEFANNYIIDYSDFVIIITKAFLNDYVQFKNSGTKNVTYDGNVHGILVEGNGTLSTYVESQVINKSGSSVTYEYYKVEGGKETPLPSAPTNVGIYNIYAIFNSSYNNFSLLNEIYFDEITNGTNTGKYRMISPATLTIEKGAAVTITVNNMNAWETYTIQKKDNLTRSLTYISNETNSPFSITGLSSGHAINSIVIALSQNAAGIFSTGGFNNFILSWAVGDGIVAYEIMDENNKGVTDNYNITLAGSYEIKRKDINLSVSHTRQYDGEVYFQNGNKTIGVGSNRGWGFEIANDADGLSTDNFDYIGYETVNSTTGAYSLNNGESNPNEVHFTTTAMSLGYDPLNYRFNFSSFTVTIVKRVLSLSSVSQTIINKVYDGTSALPTDLTFVDGQGNIISTGNYDTNMSGFENYSGSYANKNSNNIDSSGSSQGTTLTSVTINFTNKNYSFQSDVMATISQRDITISIDRTFLYTGNVVSSSGILNGVNNEKINWTVQTKKADVGTYTPISATGNTIYITSSSMENSVGVVENYNITLEGEVAIIAIETDVPQFMTNLDDLIYNGNNQIPKIQISLTWQDGAENRTVYIFADEPGVCYPTQDKNETPDNDLNLGIVFSFYINNGTVENPSWNSIENYVYNPIINAGNYKVVITGNNNVVEFESTEFEFIVKPKEISLKGIEKIYDGTVSVDITTINNTKQSYFEDILSNDLTDVYLKEGTYASQNVGNNLALSGLALSGDKANNYKIAEGQVGKIIKKSVTISDLTLKTQYSKNPFVYEGTFETSDLEANETIYYRITVNPQNVISCFFSALGNALVGIETDTLGGEFKSTSNFILVFDGNNSFSVEALVLIENVDEAQLSFIYAGPSVDRRATFEDMFGFSIRDLSTYPTYAVGEGSNAPQFSFAYKKLDGRDWNSVTESITNIGSYKVEVSLSNVDSNENYLLQESFTFEFTVTPFNTVLGNSDLKDTSNQLFTKEFGTVDMDLKRVISTLFNEEVTITFTRAEGEDPGSYDFSLATSSNPNYTFSIEDLANRAFTITQSTKILYVEFDKMPNMVYQGITPSFGSVDYNSSEEEAGYYINLIIGGNTSQFKLKFSFSEESTSLTEKFAQITNKNLLSGTFNITNPNKDVGVYSITLSGGSSYYFSVVMLKSDQSLTINQREITFVSSITKVFDFNVDIELSAFASNIIASDNVTAVGKFSSLNAGIGIQIQDITLSGSASRNYSSPSSLTGSISPKSVTIVIPETIVYGNYDGNSFKAAGNFSTKAIQFKVNDENGSEILKSQWWEYIDGALTLDGSGKYNIGNYNFISGYGLNGQNFTFAFNRTSIEIIQRKLVVTPVSGTLLAALTKNYDGTVTVDMSKLKFTEESTSVSITGSSFTTSVGDSLTISAAYQNKTIGEVVLAAHSPGEKPVQFTVDGNYMIIDSAGLTTFNGKIVYLTKELTFDYGTGFVNDGESIQGSGLASVKVYYPFINTNSIFHSSNLESPGVVFPNPIRVGYTFLGWYLDGDTAITNDSAGINILQTKLNNDLNVETLSLVAKWAIKTFEVKIVLKTDGDESCSGGSFKINDSTDLVTYSQTSNYYTTLQLVTKANERYLFKGFYIRGSADEYTLFEANSMLNIILQKAIWLEARFESILVTVRLNLFERDASEVFKTQTKATFDGDLSGYTISGQFATKSFSVNATDINVPSVSGRGVTFIHWSIVMDNVEGDGNILTGNSDLFLSAANPAVNGVIINVYAIYNFKNYTITWDANGGKFAGESSSSIQYIDFLASISLPSDSPTRAGYTFDGWLNGEEKFEPSSEAVWTFDENKTFSAKWAANTNIITINLGGKGTASFEYTDVSTSIEGIVGGYRVFAKTGTSFTVTVMPSAGYDVSEEWTSSSDITLEKGEDLKAYTISGYVASGTITVPIAPRVNTIVIKFFKDSFFDGEKIVIEALSADDSEKITRIEENKSIVLTIPTGIKFKLSVSPITGYDIGTFMGNGVTIGAASILDGKVTREVSGFVDDVMITINLVGQLQDIKINVPRDRMSFSSYTNANYIENGTIDSYLFRAISGAEVELKIAPTYGYEYSGLSFKFEGFEDNSGAAVLVDNYTLRISGFSTHGLITLTFVPIKYKVIFMTVLEGAEENEINSSVGSVGINGKELETEKEYYSIEYLTTVTMDVIPATGYTFKGLYNELEGNNLAGTYSYEVKGDVTLYCIFKVSEYTVIYVAGANGKISGSLQQEVTHGGNAERVTAIPNDGYRFVKWAEDEYLNSIREDMNITKDLTITAIFEALDFTINVQVFEKRKNNEPDSNFKSGTVGQVILKEGQEVQIDGSYTNTQIRLIGSTGGTFELVATPTLGYKFLTWQVSEGVFYSSSTDSYGVTTARFSNFIGNESSNTTYEVSPVFEPCDNKISISFKAGSMEKVNGGWINVDMHLETSEIIFKTLNNIHNIELSALTGTNFNVAVYVMKGYTFKSINNDISTTPIISEITDNISGGFKFTFSDYTEDSAIVIELEAENYTVNFNDGGTIIVTGSVKFGEKVEYNGNVVLSRSGYTFKGWYDREIGNGKKYIDENGTAVGVFNNINNEESALNLFPYFEMNRTELKINWVPNSLGITLTDVCTNLNEAWIYNNQVHFKQNTDIYLRAPSREGYQFVEWKIVIGNDTQHNGASSMTVKENSATTITIEAVYFVAIDVRASAGGTAVAAQEGKRGNYYNSQAEVVLEATAESGYTFFGWKKLGTTDIISQETSYNIGNIGEPSAYEAVFVGNDAVVKIGEYQNGSITGLTINGVPYEGAFTSPINVKVGDVLVFSISAHSDYFHSGWNPSFENNTLTVKPEDAGKEIIITPLFTVRQIAITFEIIFDETKLISDDESPAAVLVNGKDIFDNSFDYNGSLTLRLTPNIGYKLTFFKIDGVDYLSNVAADGNFSIEVRSLYNGNDISVVIKYKRILWIDFKTGFKGSGTNENPYVISTAEELAMMSYAVNQGDDRYQTAYYVLDLNIDLEGKFWQPIGTEESPFSGVFDFRGFSVYGINLDGIYEKVQYNGLFGVIASATIVSTTPDYVIVYIVAGITGGLLLLILFVVLLLAYFKKRRHYKLANVTTESFEKFKEKPLKGSKSKASAKGTKIKTGDME